MEVLPQSVQQPQQLAKHQRATNPLNQMAAALTTPGTVEAVVRVVKANMQLRTMKLRVRNTLLSSNNDLCVVVAMPLASRHLHIILK